MSRGRAWTPGRDSAAVRHPGTAGRSDDGGRHHVAVVGGGVAGLAAATALAERGVAVTLLESCDQLGGRVRSWPVDDEHSVTEHSADEHGVDGSGADEVGARTMSRGFHAFFRQYYNLRTLLRRADPALQRLQAVADYPLLSRQGHRDSFARIPRTPPVNLLAFVLRSPTFTIRDLAKVDTAAAGELLDVDFPRSFADHDGESAAQFLDRLRFPDAARHLALEVFARSFFADPEDFSAGELIGMFHTYFLGSAEGLLFDVPDDDYDTALWAPLADYLRGRGVALRTRTPVTGLRSDGDGVVLQTDGEDVRADAVVVATDLRSTQHLLSRGALDGDDSALATWHDQLAALRPAPPFAVWRLWLDRPASPERPAFLGTAGFGPTDNISVVERFEDGAADWARRTGGSVVELHAYALSPDADHDDVRRQLRSTLDELYPEFVGARPVAEEYLVNADCPLIGTEPWSERPTVASPDPRVLLAGDGVRCDFPVALMERAATTGFQAANALLAGWQLAGHDLWTVPLGARTRFARHAGQAAGRR